MTDSQGDGLTMLDIDDEAAGIIAYRVDEGAITEEAADPIWDRVDAAAAAGNKVRLFVEMDGMPRAEGGVYWEKLKNLRTLLKTIERVAVVGDAGWLDWYTRIINPITKADIRHFNTEDRQAAIDWVRA